jgi:hypothetical protein
MRKAGRADPQISELWRQIRRESAEWRRGLGRPSEARELTYDQAMEVLVDPSKATEFGTGRSSGSLFGWARAATDDEWLRMAAELATLPDEDPRWLRALHYFYGRRPFPGDPERLISVARAARLDRFRYFGKMNETERLALRAMNALAKVNHPTVRSFALELLDSSAWTSHAASLLEPNYVDGDLELLAAVFRRERSEWQRHGIGMSILRIDKRLAPAEAPPVLLMLYEHVRCGMCRDGLVGRLHAHDALPARIARECCFDAYFELREDIAEMVPGICATGDPH